MSETNRRRFMGRSAAAATAATVAASAVKAQEKSVKRVIYPNNKKPAKTPLFSGTVA
jgi:hypothetical protein